MKKQTPGSAFLNRGTIACESYSKHGKLTIIESIKYTNKHNESKFRNGFENMLNL